MKEKLIWIIISIFVLIGLGVILVFTAKKTTVSSIESLKECRSKLLVYEKNYKNSWLLPDSDDAAFSMYQRR